MILELSFILHRTKIAALIENLRPKFQLVFAQILILIYFCFKMIWSML